MGTGKHNPLGNGYSCAIADGLKFTVISEPFSSDDSRKAIIVAKIDGFLKALGLEFKGKSFSNLLVSGIRSL